LVAALVSTATLFYWIWLPTPNYNTVNVIGAVLVATGLTGALSRSPVPLDRGDIGLIGLGLAICAVVKPPTAVMLAGIVAVGIHGSLRERLVYLAFVGVLSAVLTAAALLAAIGSPSEIVTGYLEGVRLVRDLTGAESSMLGQMLLRAYPSKAELGHICAMLIFGAAIEFASASTSVAGLKRNLVVMATALVFMADCILVKYYADGWNNPVSWSPLLLVIGMAASQRLRTRIPLDCRVLWLAACVSLIPIAVGFGSYTGVLRSAAQAAPLWSVAAFLVLTSVFEPAKAKSLLLPLLLVTVASCGTVLSWAQSHPQRQVAPLWQQTEPITVLNRGSSLWVDPATAKYFNTLSGAMTQNGFSPGTPIIDLTGGSPATIFVLGGRAIGWPSLLGGYPGSQTLANRTLRMVSRGDLNRAWILSSPDGHARLHESLLAELGLTFPVQYQSVTEVVTGIRSEKQFLWKPVYR
jgi:hypothetical protein